MKQLKETIQENTGSIVQESFGDKFRETIFRFFHPFSKMYPRPFIVITQGRTSSISGKEMAKYIYDTLCQYMEENYESYIKEVRIQKTVDSKLDNRIYLLDKNQITYKMVNTMLEGLAKYLQELADEIGSSRLLAFQNDVSGGHELELCLEVVEDERAAYPGISVNTFRKHSSPIVKRLEKITQQEVAAEEEPEEEPKEEPKKRPMGYAAHMTNNQTGQDEQQDSQETDDNGWPVA